jgi:hypothetical protein
MNPTPGGPTGRASLRSPAFAVGVLTAGRTGRGDVGTRFLGV